jgi:hypothetical protein
MSSSSPKQTSAVLACTPSGEVMPATIEGGVAVPMVPRDNALAGINVEALLAKAVDSKAAVEVLERLQTLRKELRAEQAEEAFNEALSQFQAECPQIEKQKGVKDRSGTVAYKYAPLEAIEAQIRPLLRKHGFSHTFDTDTASAAGWVIARCIVTHKAGHRRESVAKFPLGNKTPIMSDTQVYAAALTFANRRALCNAYGLVIAGEDIDGQTGKLKPAGPSSRAAADQTTKPLATELWNLLTGQGECKAGEPNWQSRNQWLWAREILDPAVPETAPHLSVERFCAVVAKVKEVLA